MFLVGMIEKFNALDDTKVSMLTAVGLLIVINVFLGIRMLSTGEGMVFLQQEAYVIAGLSTVVNGGRAILNRKKKNGNGNGVQNGGQ